MIHLAVAAAGGSWWSRHGAHVILLAVPTSVIGAIAAWSDVRRHLTRPTPPRSNRRKPLVLLAAAFSLVAAAIHTVVCPEHFGEAFLYGAFFVITATAQAGWAVLALTRPRRWLLAAGLGGNVFVIALWGVTRTAGVPLGPGHGEVESVGALDVIATVAELGIVVCLLVALWSALPRRVTTVEA